MTTSKRQRKQKARRKPYDGDPVMVIKRATWGTVAEGKVNEKTRDLKNRIHELETALSGAQAVIRDLAVQKADLQNKLETAAPKRFVDALRTVCLLPISTSVDLGIDDALLRLCVWLAEIESTSLATGNSEAS